MIPVESIVNQVRVQDRFRNDEYDVLLNYALRGVKEVMGRKGLPKTVFLKLNDNNVAKLPDDYLTYTKVGTLIGDRIYAMAPNPNMFKGDPDCPPENNNASDFGFFFDNYFNPWEHRFGRLFGYGTTKNKYGTYRVDEIKHQIEFSDEIQGTPLLEYRSSALDITNGTVMVDPLAEEALIAYVEWKALSGRMNVPDYMIQRAKDEWLYQKNEYVIQKFSFTWDEFKQAVDYGYMQAPKH